jgi:hypothetical protein
VGRSRGRRFVDTVAVLVRGTHDRPEVRSALERGTDGETVLGTGWPILARLLGLDPGVSG